MNYYNEYDPKAAAGLEALIEDGLIPAGVVDKRSIADVKAADLAGFTQCHFFAGIGGWSRALDLALWPHDRPVWTGSCPCQPFSASGKQKGQDDDRHLWPAWFALISQCRPAVIFGEQVANAISHGWLDGVYADMEGLAYACGSAVLPACAVDAPHRRDRLWFVAFSECAGEGGGGEYQCPQKAAARMESGHQINLSEQVLLAALWTTPSATDGERGGTITPAMTGSSLTQQIGSLWCSPAMRDYKDTMGMATQRPDGKNRHDHLPRQVFGAMRNGSLALTEKPGASPQLNPGFPFWLMGYMKEWVFSVQRGMLSCRKKPRASSSPVKKP